MLWLTGLVGAMLAGSVAILGTMPFGPDEAEDDAEAGQDDIATTFDVVTAMPESDPSGASVNEAAAVRSTSTSGPDIAATPDAEAEAPGDDPGRVWTTLSPDSGALELGTDADESFAGTGRTDVIDGAAGADIVTGGAGDDSLSGGAGDDLVAGEGGDDTLHGDAGEDILRGGGGADLLFGHDGDDHLDGGEGEDVLFGGLGADALSGGAGDDALHGREGADTLTGGAGQDTLMGGDGDDLLRGTADADGGIDFLNGQDGDDTLEAGAADVLSGGEGHDLFRLGSELTTDPARLADFDPSEDKIVILYNPGQPVPDVALVPDPDDVGVVSLTVDGEVVARLAAADAPDAGAIALLARAATDGPP
ncbi:type I secretion target repeat-containing protein [Roseivivax marinus]|uniref:Type I secretion target repeat-containing protein n=1 Tax=Roseivivax marinus TaxID=1379903 RepID=W4HF21_9RHOB|nr:calcium-binding protein [Roseivivax marinus]ETW11304.1 type I secretion target repeat-containing protein [Roseivivax marinus]